MTAKCKKILITMTIFSLSLVGCGESKKGSSNSNSGSNDDSQNEANATAFQKVPPSVELDVKAKKDENGGTLDEKYGVTIDNMRLLKPSELDRKTQEIFGTEWTVEVSVFDPNNAQATEQQNGFDAFASNLNGIDYDSLNDYSETVSAIYMSTHEKFCRDMSTAAFADAATRAKFFQVVAEADTLKTNEAGIKENLRQISVRMFGDDISQDAEKWALVIDLYKDLEGSTAQARVNKHPLELTVQALCFTAPFVHTY